jgi:RND family efflux transporter MFP subunit
MSGAARARGATGLAAAGLTVLSFAAAAAAGGKPPEPPDPSGDAVVLRHCLIEYEHNTPIGSPFNSMIQDCLVVTGQRVKAGKVLGRLQDTDLRAEVALREAEAASDVEIRLYEAKHAQAAARLRRTEALVQRKAVSQEEFVQHKLEAAAAVLEVEQAKYRRKLAGLHLDLARASLKNRELVSPHDGVVAAVLKRKGEPVAPRDPIFQIVDPDHLRVVGKVDVTEVGRLRVGQPARVVAEIAGADLPIEHEAFPGRVTYIDTRVDPMTRTCTIFVEATNRDGKLRAGLEARVEIDPSEPAEARQPRAAPETIEKR